MIHQEDLIFLELTDITFDEITVIEYIETVINALNINIGCEDSDSDDENVRPGKHSYKTYYDME